MALNRREVRERAAAAREFASKARPGTVYYQPHHYPGMGTLLREVTFKPAPRLGISPHPRWYGTLTAEDCWLQGGPLYDERGHRDIRGLLTVTERREQDAKDEERFLNSPGWAEAIEQSTRGTAFRPGR